MLTPFSQYELVVQADPDSELRAEIACYTQHPNYVGSIRFYSGKVPRSFALDTMIMLAMSFDMFPALMDIVRLDKPLVLELLEDNPPNAGVTFGVGRVRSVDYEPVGAMVEAADRVYLQSKAVK